MHKLDSNISLQSNPSKLKLPIGPACPNPIDIQINCHTKAHSTLGRIRHSSVSREKRKNNTQIVDEARQKNLSKRSQNVCLLGFARLSSSTQIFVYVLVGRFFLVFFSFSLFDSLIRLLSLQLTIIHIVVILVAIRSSKHILLSTFIFYESRIFYLFLCSLSSENIHKFDTLSVPSYKYMFISNFFFFIGVVLVIVVRCRCSARSAFFIRLFFFPFILLCLCRLLLLLAVVVLICPKILFVMFRIT